MNKYIALKIARVVSNDPLSHLKRKEEKSWKEVSRTNPSLLSFQSGKPL
jgi:hypothetical protein